METLSNEVKIAVVILSSGSHHFISQEVYEQICLAEKDSFIQLPNKVMFKMSAVMDILPIDEYDRQHPERQENHTDYHQPYTKEPALGFLGTISQIRHLKDLEAFARGVQKVIDARKNEGLESKNAEELLKVARKRYAMV